MKNKTCGIYKISNTVNNKIYIGQSVDCNERFRAHLGNARNHKIDTPLYNDINLYGADKFKFEIIEKCSKDELNELEKYWIITLNTIETGYNHNIGGGCVSRSEETHEKLSDNGHKNAAKNLINQWTDPKFREMMSEVNKINGKKNSKNHWEDEKFREMMSETHSNSKWMTNGETTRRIPKKDVQKYINNGWKLGRKNK